MAGERARARLQPGTWPASVLPDEDHVRASPSPAPRPNVRRHHVFGPLSHRRGCDEHTGHEHGGVVAPVQRAWHPALRQMVAHRMRRSWLQLRRARQAAMVVPNASRQGLTHAGESADNGVQLLEAVAVGGA